MRAISHIHRNQNETKKMNALKPDECFHIYVQKNTEPKATTKPKTCMNWIVFFLFVFGGPSFSTYNRLAQNNSNYTCRYTAMCVVYYLVIMEAIDELSSKQFAMFHVIRIMPCTGVCSYVQKHVIEKAFPSFFLRTKEHGTKHCVCYCHPLFRPYMTSYPFVKVEYTYLRFRSNGLMNL